MDTPVVPPMEPASRRGDDRRKASAQRRGDLKAEGRPAVAYARAEQLGEVGRLQPEHGSVPEAQGHDYGDNDDQRIYCALRSQNSGKAKAAVNTVPRK
jgi:hypothetical protein